MVLRNIKRYSELVPQVGQGFRSKFFPNTKKGRKMSGILLEDANDYRLKNMPSPSFKTTNNATITTGSIHHVNIHDRTPASEKFGAMTNMIIANTSDEDINIWLNQDSNNTLFVPANSIQAYEKEDLGGGYISYSIENLGTGTIALSGVQVRSYRKGLTPDNAFLKIVKGLA
jgi:hypothetical protein